MNSKSANPFFDLFEFFQSKKNKNKNDPRNPLIIFIGGGWGTGKSTSAVLLASALRVANVVHTDILRSCLRVSRSEEYRKVMNLATYETWRLISNDISEENLLNGFTKQSMELMPSLSQVLREAMDFGKDTIVEGMHLLPSLYKQHPIANDCCFVFFTVSPERFKKRIEDRCRTTYLRRNAERYLSEDRYTKISMINKVLIKEALKWDVPVIDLEINYDLERCLDIFKRYLTSLW